MSIGLLSRFFLTRLAVVVSLLMFVIFTITAKGAWSDEKHVLTVHHFLSPTHILQTALLEPLSEDISRLSGGELSLKIYPSMALGGKANELYHQVRDGSVDIVWSLIGYTPGIFPRSEVFELPGVHLSSATATGLAMHDTRDLLEADFDDVELLFLHVHPGNAIHTVDDKIYSLSDIRNLKLRTPSRTGAWMISSWKAAPVAMPIPALPQALSRKAVDGALVPFEVMPSLGLEKLTKFSVIAPDNHRFGTAVFYLVMNKQRFTSLPERLQKILKSQTGLMRIRYISQEWDRSDARGFQAQLETGAEIHELSDEKMREFSKTFESINQRWVKEVSELGIDGEKLLKAAKKAVQARENERS